MNYHNLSRALKYKLIDKQPLHSILSESDGEHLHPQDPADHVLLDYLEEQEDPRAEIVRRDMGYRGESGNKFLDNLADHEKSISRLTENDSSDRYCPIRHPTSSDIRQMASRP